MGRNKQDLSFKSGFTIIELLVTLSIIGILSSAGLASYLSFSRKQQVVANTRKVVEDLRLTQSLAANNQKPEDCDTLRSYSFTVTSQDPASYQITAECTDTYTIKTETLSGNISLVGNLSWVKFTVLRQGVYFGAGDTLVVTGYNRTKSITVGNAGEINVND